MAFPDTHRCSRLKNFASHAGSGRAEPHYSTTEEGFAENKIAKQTSCYDVRYTGCQADETKSGISDLTRLTGSCVPPTTDGEEELRRWQRHRRAFLQLLMHFQDSILVHRYFFADRMRLLVWHETRPSICIYIRSPFSKLKKRTSLAKPCNNITMGMLSP